MKIAAGTRSTGPCPGKGKTETGEERSGKKAHANQKGRGVADKGNHLATGVDGAHRAKEKEGKRNTLEPEARTRLEQQAPQRGIDADDEGQETEEHSLDGYRGDAGEKTAGAEQPQVGEHENDEKALPPRWSSSRLARRHFTTASANATAAIARAATRSCGTRASRSRAIADSTMPGCHAGARDPSQADGKVHGPRAGAREHDGHGEASEDPQLESGAVLDVGEVDSAMVQHHHLVDHRELQVRGGIVHGDARVLRQGR